MSARVDDRDFSFLSKWLSTHCTRPYMMLGGAFCEAAWRALSKWHHVHHGHLQLWFFSFFLETKKHELGRVLWGRKCTEGLKGTFFSTMPKSSMQSLNVANDGPQIPVLHLSAFFNRCFYSSCFLSESPGSEASCMVRPSLNSAPSRTRLGAPALLRQRYQSCSPLHVKTACTTWPQHWKHHKNG